MSKKMTPAECLELYGRRNYKIAPSETQEKVNKKVYLIVNDEYWGTLGETSFKDVYKTIKKTLDPLYNMECIVEPIGKVMYLEVKMLFPPLIELRQQLSQAQKL